MPRVGFFGRIFNGEGNFWGRGFSMENSTWGDLIELLFEIIFNCHNLFPKSDFYWRWFRKNYSEAIFILDFQKNHFTEREDFRSYWGNYWKLVFSNDSMLRSIFQAELTARKFTGASFLLSGGGFTGISLHGRNSYAWVSCEKEIFKKSEPNLRALFKNDQNKKTNRFFNWK